MKNPEVGTVAWIILDLGGPKCNHKHPYKKEADGYLMNRRQQMIVAARCYVTGFENGERGPEPRTDRTQLWKLEKARKQVPPQSPEGA